MPRLILRLLLLACLLSVAPPAVLAGPHLDHFRRGVNLSHWYAQSHDGRYDEEHLATYFTADDARLIADAGLDHVRLTLNPVVVFDPQNPGVLRSAETPAFVGRVEMLLDAGLGVVVDLQPDDDYKASLNEPDAAEAFVADWRAFAGALAHTPADRVWLEVMNEPHAVRDWRTLQERAVAAIRESAPDHTIVVTGGGWSHAASLYGEPDDKDHAPTQEFVPYDVPNLVYTFHFYDPFMFTHQVAEWGWPPATRTNGLPWPVTPADARKVADAATGDDEAHGHVRWQAERGYFTPEWVDVRLKGVVDWAMRHRVPVYLGEFGVYAKSAPRDARLAWHAHVAGRMADFGIGWCMWDYSGGFALFPGEPGTRRADEQMLRACGVPTRR